MILLLLLFILALVLTSLLVQKLGNRPSTAARKVLHIGAIGASALSVYVVPDLDALLITVILLAPIIGFVVLKGFMKDAFSGRRSWGILWYVLVFALLLFLFRKDAPHLVYYPLMVLALADGVAALIGIYLRSRSYRLGGDQRTKAGSVAFFTATFVVLAFSHYVIGMPTGFTIPQLIFVSIFLTLTEAGSSNGSDNLWVPVVLVYWLLVHPVLPTAISTAIFTFLLVLTSAWYAVKLGWLSAGGALIALLLGWFYLFNPEVKWVIIPMSFFICGSLLSKLNTRKDKGPARSGMQVLANGGMPTLFLAAYFVTGMQGFLIGFICGFGAALSDTASSEIGIKRGGKTYSILGFKPYVKGVSGGVSIDGSLSGMLFAMFLSFLAMVLLEERSIILFIGIALVSFAGNITDSVLGQLIQEKFFDKSSAEWHDNRPENVLVVVKGIPGVTNDMVNLISTSVACLAGYAVHQGIAGL